MPKICLLKPLPLEAQFHADRARPGRSEQSVLSFVANRCRQGNLCGQDAQGVCPHPSKIPTPQILARSSVRLARQSKCLAHLSKCSARTNRSGTRAEATNKREISQSSLVGNGGCAVSGCQSAGKRCSNHSFLGDDAETCRWPPRTNLWRGMTSPARGWNRPRSGERHP